MCCLGCLLLHLHLLFLDLETEGAVLMGSPTMLFCAAMERTSVRSSALSFSFELYWVFTLSLNWPKVIGQRACCRLVRKQHSQFLFDEL